MRRPLPPELVELGDQLEGAVRRSVWRRRARRQLALNAVTGILVALPLLPGVLSASLTSTPVDAAPAAIDQPEKRSYVGAKNDFPPRVLRGSSGATDVYLAEPSTLRRAMR